MEGKKQTAVEWLCEQWLYLDSEFDMMLIDKKIYWEKLRELQVKAKQMEKEIIRTAYLDGIDNEYTTSEQYYNETYSK
jgi:hypothetical protein